MINKNQIRTDIGSQLIQDTTQYNRKIRKEINESGVTKLMIIKLQQAIVELQKTL